MSASLPGTWTGTDTPGEMRPDRSSTETRMSSRDTQHHTDTVSRMRPDTGEEWIYGSTRAAQLPDSVSSVTSSEHE